MIHKLDTIQVVLGMNIFGYNHNGLKIGGDTYLLNTTLCWVFSMVSEPGKETTLESFLDYKLKDTCSNMVQQATEV